MAVSKTTVGGVLSAFVLAALLAGFFTPPEPGVISGEFEYVQRVVDGDTLVLGTGERVRLIGVAAPESVLTRLCKSSVRKPQISRGAWRRQARAAGV